MNADNLAPRIAMAVFSLFVCVGAVAFRMHLTDPVGEPTLGHYQEALRGDSANGYRWADVAEALAEAGRDAEARQAFTRAVALSPGIPAVWLRYTNYCFFHNDTKTALPMAAHVLATVPDYDGILFHYFDRIVENPAAVLAAIGGDRRAARAWLEHLIASNNSKAARSAWNLIVEAGFGDDKLAAGYVDYLLRVKAWDGALTTWAEWLGKRRGPYPDRNLLFNGKFEMEPTAGALDWHITPDVDQFETALTKKNVTIRFLGKGNVTYDHLSQVAILPRAGTYRLTMRLKTEGITTNEGIRLAVTDLGLATEPISGTNDWMTAPLDVTVDQARAIRVAVLRRPSEKFDNKIAGTVWIDSVTLIPAITRVNTSKTWIALKKQGNK